MTRAQWPSRTLHNLAILLLFQFLSGLGSDTLARTILSVPGTHLPFAANQSWMPLEQWAISSGRRIFGFYSAKIFVTTFEDPSKKSSSVLP